MQSGREIEAKPALLRSRGLQLRRRGSGGLDSAGGRVPRPAPLTCTSPSRGKTETEPESGRSSQEMDGELHSQERRGHSKRSTRGSHRTRRSSPTPQAVPPNTRLSSCNSASSQKEWMAVDCLRGRLREPQSQRGDKTRA